MDGQNLTREADRDYDVVVVGAGAAGLTAALEASSKGVKVLLVEGSTKVGGASKLSGGIIMGAATKWQRAAGIEDSPLAFFHYYLTVNRWNVEPSCVWSLTHEAGPAIEWASQIGVPISETVIPTSDEMTPRGHVVEGQGEALISSLLFAARQQPGIDILLKTRVSRLLMKDGAVIGTGFGRDEVTSSAVILATGGFGANRSLLEKYAPRALVAGDWTWYVGPDTSQGDAIALSGQADAQLVGYDHVSLSLRPNFSHEGEGDFPGWLVIVNGDGRRFMNEMAPYSMNRHVAATQVGPIFGVLDEQIKRRATTSNVRKSKRVVRPGESVGDWTKDTLTRMVDSGVVLRADTVSELAEKMNIPARNLRATLEVYNEGARDGVDPFYLKRGSMLQPIENPPYYAAEMRFCLLGITMMGPRVDGYARVINSLQRPIRGLYAAGECTGGVMGEAYVGSGNSLANCLAFGRIAARASLADLCGQAASIGSES